MKKKLLPLLIAAGAIALLAWYLWPRKISQLLPGFQPGLIVSGQAVVNYGTPWKDMADVPLPAESEELQQVLALLDGPRYIRTPDLQIGARRLPSHGSATLVLDRDEVHCMVQLYGPYLLVHVIDGQGPAVVLYPVGAGDLHQQLMDLLFELAEKTADSDI